MNIDKIKNEAKSKSYIENIININNKFIVKNKKLLSLDSVLNINPKEIILFNSTKMQIYEIPIKIINKYDRLVKILINPPNDKKTFSINCKNIITLSPGISFNLVLKYTCNKEIFIQDNIQIEDLNKNKINIPINIFPKILKLEFPNYVDFGFMNINKEIKKTIQIKNSGQKIGNIQIKLPEKCQELRIEPNKFTLFPFEIKKIDIFFKSSVSGIFQSKIKIITEEDISENFIDITGTIIDHLVFIVNNKGEEFKELNFKNILYGKEEIKEFLIVNNSPKVVKFSLTQINLKINNETNKIQTPNEFGEEKLQKFLKVVPTQGKIDSYSHFKINLKIKLNPNDEIYQNFLKYCFTQNSNDLLFTKQKYSIFFNLDCQEIKILSKVIFKIPEINITQKKFNFTDTFVGNSNIIKFKIISNEEVYTIKINFLKVSQFIIKEEEFYLNPKEEKIIELFFNPKNIGEFRIKIPMIVNDSFKIFLDCYGKGIILLNNKRTKQMSNNSVILNKSLNYRIDRKSNWNQSINLKEGLPEKTPIIQSKVNGLFVTRSIKKYNPNDFNKIIYNPNQKLSGRILNSHVDTLSKKREVRYKLTFSQLKNIYSGPKQFNFENIFLKSEKILFFKVKNEMEFSIVAKLKLDKIELQNSFNKSQIIGSGQEGSFSISFKGEKLGDFDENIIYTINNFHEFKINIKANVISPELNFNKKLLNFKFNDDKIGLKCGETIKISNDGNSKIKYSIRLNTNNFFISENDGEIIEGESKILKIYYCPKDTNLSHEELIYFNVENNPKPHIIKLFGNVNDSNGVLNTDFIDFGQISISQKCSKHFTIKNSSRNNLIYEINKDELPNNIVISPLSGIISYDSSDKLEIIIQNNSVKEYNREEINIYLRGGKILKIYFSAVIIIPIIKIEPEFWDCGEIFWGNILKKEVQLINISSIPATVNLDLNNNNLDFIQINQLNEEDSICIAEKELDNSLINDDMKSPSIENSEYNNNKNIKNYDIILKPNKKLDIVITFSPEISKKYNINLPFNWIGYKGSKNCKLNIICNCLSPQFIMKPIKGVIDFGRITLANLNNPNSNVIFKKIEYLEIINPDKENQLKFKIIQNENNEKIFKLSPLEGVIDCDNFIKIKFQFNTSKILKANESYKLIFDQGGKTIENDIVAKVQTISPRILFDKKEIIINPIPLNVSSQMTLKVFNEGYNNDLFILKWSGNFENLLSAKINQKEFRLGGNKNSISIEVKFKSNKPISITSFLNVIDESGKMYSIPVSATSDNCSLTLYSYILMKNINYFKKNNGDIVGEEESNNSFTIEENKSFRGSIKSNSSYYNFSIVSNPKKLFNKLSKLCEFIKLFINKNILNENINDFPNDIIRNNGNIIYKLLTMLTGNKELVKSKVNLNGTELVNERIEKLMSQYINLITNLKESGALLNTIKPEYFLNYQDFLTYNKKQVGEVNSHYHKITENIFNFYSLDSWIFLILQILKLFYLVRVDLNTLKKMFPDQSKTLSISNSNIYSFNEVIVFKWCELIFNEVYKNEGYCDEILNPEVDFIKENYLYCLGYYYYPFMEKEELQNLSYSETIKYLEHFDLELPTNPEDINNIELILNLINMFLYLPFYKPKETIYFETNLNESITNQIVIKNPTNKTIYYNVIIENERETNDYSSEIDFIKIDSNQVFEFSITFSGRLSIPIIGRAIFKSKKENCSNAIPLIFDLKSNIKNKIPNKVINLKNSYLYEYKQYEININNPFELDEDFNVIIEENFLEIPSFFLIDNRIKLFKNMNNIIKFNFLALELKEYKCIIVLQNFTLGEYIYEINIKSEIKYEEKINKVYNLDNPTYNIFHTIEHENKNLIEGLRCIEDNIKNNTLISAKSKEKYYNILDGNKTKNFYNVILNPKNIIQFKNNNFKLNEKNSSTEIKLNLNYNSPLYNQNIYLYLHNNNFWDIRLFLFNLSLYPKTLKILLEIETKQRTEVYQSIPIYNSHDKETNFNIEKVYNNKENNFFYYSNELFIDKLSLKDYKIVFKPLFGLNDKLHLLLTNPITKEKYEILVYGKILDPDCEKEYSIECKSGDKKYLNIDFRPTQNNEKFEVVYNEDIFKGKNKILVENNYYEYQLEINSSIPGKFLEKIQFTSVKNEIYWFCVELNIIGNYKKIEKDIKCVIRNELTIEIPLENKSNKESLVYVNINGNYLSGAKKQIIEPNSIYNYKLLYYPLDLIKEKGFIIFKSSIIGEIYYDLNLESQIPKMIKIPLVKAELGKNYIFKLEIQNKSSKTEKFILKNSNHLSFFPKNTSLKLEKKEIGEFLIEFIPFDVGITEISDIIINSENQYPFKYQLTAIGEPPKEFNQKEIIGEIYKETKSKVIFKNPFNNEINVNIFITDVNNNPYIKDDFKFLYKKEILKIYPKQELEFSYIFYPKEIGKYTIKIHFKYNDRLVWIFPIKAMSFYKHDKIFEKLFAKSNIKIEKNIYLPIMPSYNINNIDDINYFLISKNKIANKWIQIKKIEWINKEEIGSLIDNNMEESKYIKILIKFQPLKPMVFLCNFQIKIKKTEGVILFPINFISELPSIHQTIELFATPQKFCKIKLPFNSPYLRNSIEFKAYLTPDSSPEFFISPLSGKLQPEMRNGSFFYIEYKPLNFGCKKQGEFRIETSENLWRFKIPKPQTPKPQNPKTPK